MPAPNEFVWYKWFPAKAMTSLRWASLTVTEEGVYRRLYDLASLAQPADRRGYFYEHDQAASLNEVLKFLRIDARTGHKCVEKFAKLGLMAKDKNGAWGFPDFAKHQRGGNLRQRPDGLGSAEAAQIRHRFGTKSGQKAAVDADADADPPLPPKGVVAVEDNSKKQIAEKLAYELMAKSEFRERFSARHRTELTEAAMRSLEAGSTEDELRQAIATVDSDTRYWTRVDSAAIELKKQREAREQAEAERQRWLKQQQIQEAKKQITDKFHHFDRKAYEATKTSPMTFDEWLADNDEIEAEWERLKKLEKNYG